MDQSLCKDGASRRTPAHRRARQTYERAAWTHLLEDVAGTAATARGQSEQATAETEDAPPHDGVNSATMKIKATGQSAQQEPSETQI